jgi:hypothetical protein
MGIIADLIREAVGDERGLLRVTGEESLDVLFGHGGRSFEAGPIMLLCNDFLSGLWIAAEAGASSRVGAFEIDESSLPKAVTPRPAHRSASGPTPWITNGVEAGSMVLKRWQRHVQIPKQARSQIACFRETNTAAVGVDRRS